MEPLETLITVFNLEAKYTTILRFTVTSTANRILNDVTSAATTANLDIEELSFKTGSLTLVVIANCKNWEELFQSSVYDLQLGSNSGTTDQKP
ncbi:hypothetical protein K7432_004120 [Basidiobolus ranarum]|uniref:Uncharacterized protein n=1 Tax=Basidiobolus ranarum TaxID=34480 RepID=A0ABR2W533_9FUNG